MAYTPIGPFVDFAAPYINASALNHLEAGIQGAQAGVSYATESNLPATGDYYGQIVVVSSFSAGGITAPVTSRWNGTAWVRWDCEWQAFPNLSASNLGTYGGNPGWTYNAVQWRYRAGRVLYQGSVILNGGSAVASGQISVSLPVAAPSTTVDRNQIAGANSTHPTPQRYVLTAAPSGGGLYFGYINGSGQSIATGASAPFTWGQSDVLGWAIEYDPA